MPGKSRVDQQAQELATEEGRTLDKAYSPAFNVRATEYCLLGATNEELAAFFGVSLSSVERWMVEYPKFRRSIEDGREAADARVARALHRRAVGMTVKKERAVVVRGELKTLFLKEELPPDTNAAALWLSNRQRSKWRSTNAGGDAAAGFDLAGFVGALGAGIAKGLASKAQPGDAAQPIDPLDVALSEPEKDR
jgi:hypothetical protein